MKLLSKFLELAGRLWPDSHKQFEEMSVLAVTGQLDASRMSELNDHVAGCNRCCRFVESAAQISVRAMPLLADTRASAADIVPPEGMRARFLSRFVQETGNRRVVPMSPSFWSASEFLPVIEGRMSDRPRAAESLRVTASLHRTKWAAVFAAVCLVVAAGGVYFGKLTMRVPAQKLYSSVPPSQANSNNNADITDQIAQLQEQKASLQRELVRMKRKLEDASKEQKSLATALAATRDRLAEYTAQTESSLERSSVESDQAKQQLAAAQNQANQLTEQLAQAAVQLAVQKKTTADAKSRLEITEIQLQKALGLDSAKGEFAGILGARNLHIVDVYDADASGKRQRPFGRVFYIEGKSLVFYAYDLRDSGHFKADVVFHVWGGKTGVSEVTHSLGILHKDDGSDSRWSMTFDDPKVLAAINSVFVTAEAGNKRSDVPHGKKILYAYFGSPANHP